MLCYIINFYNYTIYYNLFFFVEHENERKIKEYGAKYNFNYNENAEDKEIRDKLLAGDVDMELMENWPGEELKLKPLMIVPHREEESLQFL